MNELLKELTDLIDSQPITYINSIDDDGYPTGKAVFSRREREGVRCYYFSTCLSARHTQQYLKNSKASIYFCNQLQGVMFQGIMEVLQDLESKKKIWRDTDIQYYKEGVNDSDYCVLKFTATKGRYYFHNHSEDFVVLENEIDKLYI